MGPAAVDLASDDLLWVVSRGLERGGHLLSAGECAVLDGLVGLSPAPLSLLARLWTRRTRAWRVESLGDPGAVQALVRAGWLDDRLPLRARLEAMTLPELKALCREGGLRRGGRKAEVLERLVDLRVEPVGDWRGPRNIALLWRLARWAFLRKHPDPSTRVVERLGHARWPEFELTSGPSLHTDRRALLRWEGVLAALDAEVLGGEQARALLDDPAVRAGGRLDLRRSLARMAAEAARQLEREGAHGEALGRYGGLVGVDGLEPSWLAIRRSRCHEALGQKAEALAVLREARVLCGPLGRMALQRSGRRLAKGSWPPDPPLRRAPRRDLRLAGAGASGNRPLYATAAGPTPVEGAVAWAVGAAGRTVLRGEGPLFTSIFALVLGELYFLPVPGMLPGRYLSGPLDLGRPAFAERRAEAVAVALSDVRSGGAEARVRRSFARWQGVRLAGMDWGRGGVESFVSLAAGLGPEGLAGVLEVLLREGWRATRGLPDLAVLPGDPARLDGAYPSALSSKLVLIEVKGPGDSLSDEQRVWLHRLQGLGVRCEIVRVRLPE